jgi:Arc/MetJ-type ribon-helix-helix transcriptional regulator
MTRKPKAYVAALPLSSLPELQELLSRFCGGESPRGNVVMVRLGDAAVTALDELVEAALFGSRSEAAAFLLGAGIEAQRELFARVGKHSAEIKRIRQSLKRDALVALRGAAASSRRSSSSSKT